MKKKIIVILSVVLCIFSCVFRVDADAYFSVIITNDVQGYVGCKTEKQQVSLTFDDPTNYWFNVDSFDELVDVTDWFAPYYPDGIDYTAEVFSVTKQELIVTFEGNVSLTATEGSYPIEVCIPYYEDTPYIMTSIGTYEDDFDNVINDNAHYIISEPEPVVITIQYKGPYVVEGTVGEEIEPQIVEVELIDCPEEFLPSLLNTTLPTVNGLTPTITSMDIVNGKYITITYTGTPLVESQDLIHTTILKQYLKLNDIDRIVPDRDDVKFNIIAKQEEIEDEEDIVVEDIKPAKEAIYIAPKTGVN